jgi:hypothetical protein
MTYYLFLFGSLGVAGLGVWLRRNFKIAGTLIAAVGLVGCIACLVWRVQSTVMVVGSAGPDRGRAVVGYYLANQVLAEVRHKQGPILLFLPPESVLDEETASTYVGTFNRVLRGFQAVKVEVLNLDVPRKEARAGQISVAAFQKAASNHPSAVAYVSFAGVPADIESYKGAASASGAGFFVFDPWATTNWLGALKKGFVRAVIVPRPGVDAPRGTEISGEPQEVFSQLYMMATPANAEQVAEKLKAR